MVWPLRVLAVFSVIGAFLGIEAIYHRQFEGGKAEPALGFFAQLIQPFNDSPMASAAGVGAVVFGFFLALAFYRNAVADPLPEKLGWLARAMRNRFYFDELYERILIPCTQELLATIADATDQGIMLVVRGLHGTTELFGRALRLAQSGSLQTYAFLLVAGVALVL